MDAKDILEADLVEIRIRRNKGVVLTFFNANKGKRIVYTSWGTNNPKCLKVNVQKCLDFFSEIEKEVKANVGN